MTQVVRLENRATGEAGIIQVVEHLANGRERTRHFAVKSSIRVTLIDGTVKRIQKQQTALRLSEAKQVKKELDLDLYVFKKEGPAKTFAEFESEFMEYYTTTVSEATAHGQRGLFEKQIFAPWKDRRLRDITLRDVEQFVDFQTKGKSPQTRKHFITCMKKIFARAFSCGYIEADVAKEIPNPKAPNKEGLVLTHSEATRLLEYLKDNDPLIYYWVATSIYTATRIGELKALLWSDVNLDNNVIQINKTISKNKKVKHWPKGKKARTIWINEELRCLLQELHEKTYMGPESLVLPCWREATNNEQAKVLSTICRSLGITPILYKDLRATSLTFLAVAGVGVHVMKAISGHSKTDTLDRYIRLAGLNVQTLPR